MSTLIQQTEPCFYTTDNQRHVAGYCVERTLALSNDPDALKSLLPLASEQERTAIENKIERLTASARQRVVIS